MSDSHWEAARVLIERWEQVAAHVDRGFTFSFDDYLNDLDLRRIIDERLLALVNWDFEEGPGSLGEQLIAADARFRNATLEVERNVWGEDVEREEGWSSAQQWFYYRVPKSHPEWAGY